MLIIALTFCVLSCKEEHTNPQNKLFDSLSTLAFKYYIQGDETNCYNVLDQMFQSTKDQELLLRTALLKLEFESYYHPQSLISSADSLINQSRLQNNQPAMALATLWKGFGYYKTDNPVCLSIFRQSQRIAEANGNRLNQALAEQFAGDYYLYSLGNSNTALEFYISSEKIYNSHLESDSSLQVLYYYGELLNSMGILHKRSENYEKAIVYYNLYSQLSKKINNHFGRAIAINNLGVVCSKLGRDSIAISHYLVADSIFKQLGDGESFSADVYHNIGNIYSKLGNYDHSNYYLNLAKNYFSERGDTSKATIISLSLVENFLEVGKTIQASREIKTIAKSLNSVSDLQVHRSFKLLMSDLLFEKGNFEQSLKYYKEYSELSDSLSKINNSEQIGRLSTKAEIEKDIDKQKRLEENKLKEEIEETNRRNLIQYLVIVIIILLLFALLIAVRKLSLSDKVVESLLFVSFLLFYESVLILFENQISILTGGQPLFSLIIYATIALSFTPLDSYLEHKIREYYRRKQ